MIRHKIAAEKALLMLLLVVYVFLGKPCHVTASSASSIIRNMDKTVDPCDNFYKFACGNFMANTKIPEDKYLVTSFDGIINNVLSNLRTVLTDNKEEDLHTFRSLKTLYNLCINERSIEQQSNAPLHRIMEKLGGWPVLLGEKWNSTSFNWLDEMIKRRKLGLQYDSFLTISLMSDLKNSSRIIIKIDEPSLGISREELTLGINNPVVKAYLQYMVDVAVLLGADVHRATEELTHALNFKIALANITLPSEERRNQSAIYHPMTIQELAKAFPTITWREIINKLMAPIANASDDDVVNVSVPKYISNLLRLLSSTSLRIQSNYAMWRVVASTIHSLTQDFRDAELTFSSVATGQTQSEPRWKECVTEVKDFMPLAAGALYVRNFFQENVKKDVVEMVNDIREAFKDILLKVDWMDANTRENALNKLAAMYAHIAYPDELLNDTKLENYHEDLIINPTNYFDAVLNITKFSQNNKFKRYRNPDDETDWIDHGDATVINGFYSHVENSIQFPAGILQGLLFNKENPKYMNYAAIGLVIGHEITHGFDDRGRNFDGDGNLVDWWAPSTKSKFLQKAQCIINQYSNYTAKEIGINLNGIKTQGENIADNGGIKEAYLAYSKWVTRNGIEPKLPGLNFTVQQMFWITTANVWCMKYRPAYLREALLTDPHTPGEFRVIGTVSNSPEFAKDFNCPNGTVMNPTDKCSVW